MAARRGRVRGAPRPTTRTDSPGAWAAVSAGLVLSGGVLENAKGNISIASLTNGKMWIRFGVFLEPDSPGTAPVAADVSLCVALTQFGSMVGSFRQQLVSSVSSDACIAIGGFLPRASVAKMAAAFIVASADANFQVRLVFRRALVSPANPGAWANTTDSNSLGATERHTSDLAVSLGDYQWVQPGIAYSSYSGTSKGEVSVSVGVRIS